MFGLIDSTLHIGRIYRYHVPYNIWPQALLEDAMFGITACGSAAADSDKTRFNNQSDCGQDTPRIPAPKAVGCNRLLAHVQLSILSCLFEQSKRIKRNPFAG